MVGLAYRLIERAMSWNRMVSINVTGTYGERSSENKMSGVTVQRIHSFYMQNPGKSFHGRTYTLVPLLIDGLMDGEA